MVVFPNAKINLGLQVIGKRADGYHDVETLLYPVDWCDILEILEAKADQYTFTGIPTTTQKEDNLCYKAVALLRQNYEVPPINLHLHKTIPHGAGLGGGSSDAAHVLLVVNQLFNLKIEEEELASLAVKLGSDCPFFLKNKPMMATGIGDVLEPVENVLKGYFIKIIKPDFGINTAEAYKGIHPKAPVSKLKEIIKLPVEEWRSEMKNDFETTVFKTRAELQEIKNQFYEHGAIYAAMSGSGSSVFGIFATPPPTWTLPEGHISWSGKLL